LKLWAFSAKYRGFLPAADSRSAAARSGPFAGIEPSLSNLFPDPAIRSRKI
jgi:hypothetical protein